MSESRELGAVLKKRGNVNAPSDIQVITRAKLVTPTERENQLGDAIMKQNRDLLMNGLRKAGIEDSTLEKLAVFEGFSDNAGRFLVASLDMTHRMMVYLTVKLLERADYIETRYLKDETLDDEVKIAWQSAHTDIIEQVGKAYDRTLVGTQAMAKLLGTDKGEEGEKKVKPGFKPLRSAPK